MKLNYKIIFHFFGLLLLFNGGFMLLAAFLSFCYKDGATFNLFLAGISPKRVSGKTSKNRYKILTKCIKKILSDAINNGGTTLNDFSNVDGEPGYFSQILSVYGRNDMLCNRCDGTIKKIVQNQRATYYCPKCQH